MVRVFALILKRVKYSSLQVVFVVDVVFSYYLRIFYIFVAEELKAFKFLVFPSRR